MFPMMEYQLQVVIRLIRYYSENINSIYPYFEK